MRWSSVRAASASCKLRIVNHPLSGLAAVFVLHSGLLQRGAHFGQFLEAQQVVAGQDVVAAVVVSGLLQIANGEWRMVGFGLRHQVAAWVVGWLGRRGAGGEIDDQYQQSIGPSNRPLPSPLVIIVPTLHREKR